MSGIANIAVVGLIFGMIGTTVGGVAGAFLDIDSNKFVSFILEIAAGLMTSVICFNLIPESMEYSNITGAILGIFIGVCMMVFCNDFVNNRLFRKSISNNTKYKNRNLLKVGIIVGIGLAIHNFPEGLAIGSGFEASQELGLSLAIAICIHDFPEGLAMAIPLKQGGYGKLKVIIYTAISGISTGIGALVGALIGTISKQVIGVSLGFAAGAMMYIISCEIIPESNSMYKGRFSKFGNIIGIILGLALV